MVKESRDLKPDERRTWDAWRNSATPLRSRQESARTDPGAKAWALKGSTPDDWDGDRRAAKIFGPVSPAPGTGRDSSPKKEDGLSPEDQAEWDDYRRTAREYENRPASARPDQPAAEDVPVRPRAAPKPAEESGQEVASEREVAPAHKVPTKVEVVKLSKSAKKFRDGEMPPPSAGRRAMAAAVREDGIAGRMDAGKRRKMTRGKLAPDDRIDLHGLTAVEAHQAVIDFVLGARARGARLLLVVTGKGREGPTDLTEEAGILRRQVPFWLRQSPLKHLILDTEKAHASHGGAGALYVYLRR